MNSGVLCAFCVPDLCAYLVLPFRIGNISKVSELAVLIRPTINAFLITHRRLKTLIAVNIIIIVVFNITFK